MPRLTLVFAILGIAMLAVVIVLTCADIVWRRIVGGAFVDTTDIARLCMVAAVSWSIPYGFTHGMHVSVHLLAWRLLRHWQRALGVLTSAASATLLALLLWLSWQEAMLRLDFGDVSPSLGIPLICHWALLLSGLSLALIATVWRAFCAAGAGDSSGDTDMRKEDDR